MSEEKRRHIRWKKKLKVSYALTEEGDYYGDIFTEDISEEGMQILISDSLELDQTLRMKLEFANDSVPINIIGKVVFVKADGKQWRLGFEFVNMDDFQKRRIKQNLEEVRSNFKEKDEGYA
jgi:c-di-GMP-binding flagellar brake protein YcgR